MGLASGSKLPLIAEKLFELINCETSETYNRGALLLHLPSQGVIALSTSTGTIGRTTQTVGHTNPPSSFER